MGKKRPIYFNIEKKNTTTLEIKKSKFISTLLPFNFFAEELQLLKKEHSKARHFVYAYRHLNEFDQVVENQSDDGEPKGSSGPPTLSVLRGNKLINSAIITVRYFGGIKLGVGGLVRAYGDSANYVIQESELISFEKKISLSLFVDYTHSNKLFHTIESFKIKNLTKDFTSDGVDINLELNESLYEDFYQQIKDYCKIKA